MPESVDDCDKLLSLLHRSKKTIAMRRWIFICLVLISVRIVFFKSSRARLVFDLTTFEFWAVFGAHQMYLLTE